MPGPDTLQQLQRELSANGENAAVIAFTADRKSNFDPWGVRSSGGTPQLGSRLPTVVGQMVVAVVADGPRPSNWLKKQEKQETGIFSIKIREGDKVRTGNH